MESARGNRRAARCKLELVAARNLNRLPAAFCVRQASSGFVFETLVAASSSPGKSGEQKAFKLLPHAMET